MSIPLRPFGRHSDQSVSALALGGYHLGQMKSAREAITIVQAAIEAGVTFMDNAWEYNDARERGQDGPRDRRIVATACS